MVNELLIASGHLCPSEILVRNRQIWTHTVAFIKRSSEIKFSEVSYLLTAHTRVVYQNNYNVEITKNRYYSLKAINLD